MEEFLNPIQILGQLKLKKSMIGADFGCGTGGWAIPLAKMLEKGKVYAIDLLEEPLSVLESRAKSENIFNIQVVRSDLEREKGSKLQDSSVDLVLLSNLLFQVEDKVKILTEAKRVLKKGGKILVVDWKVNVPVGPESGRISADELKKTAEKLDLEVEKELEAGIYHYGLVLIKS